MTTYNRHGIAIVGAGTIVEHGHLPAYATLGLPVVSLYDRDVERARTVAAKFEGVSVAESFGEILVDERIDIVDFAITPSEQRTMAVEAALAGRHVLCQKPLAPSLTDARSMVEATAGVGRVLAVNQQMRWESSIRFTKHFLVDGSLGDPIAVHIHTNLNSDFPATHWLSREPRLMTMFGTIHFLDSLRYLFGEPVAVTAKLLRDPQQNPLGEMWINVWVEWASGLLAVIYDRYTNYAGDQASMFRVEGTRGVLKARWGLWDDYPQRSPSTVMFKERSAKTWTTVDDVSAWLPDAFGPPMLELLTCADSGNEHLTSWRDNLKTLALVEAVYASSDTARRMEMQL